MHAGTRSQCSVPEQVLKTQTCSRSHMSLQRCLGRVGSVSCFCCGGVWVFPGGVFLEASFLRTYLTECTETVFLEGLDRVLRGLVSVDVSLHSIKNRKTGNVSQLCLCCTLLWANHRPAWEGPETTPPGDGAAAASETPRPE